jgi:hypothetical protein
MTTRDIPRAVRENRSRRAAQRQGLTLTKIRRRDPRALGFGRWRLRDQGGRQLAGDEATGASLEEAELYLAGNALDAAEAALAALEASIARLARSVQP